MDDVIDQIDEIVHGETGSPYDENRRGSRGKLLPGAALEAKKKTLTKGKHNIYH